MGDFFIWLSGADPELINKCGELSHSERNKFIGFGATVIIPAIFGCLAAGYAVSTFIPTAWIYIPAAILWFLTILAIDRFLVSTLYKSKNHGKGSFYIALVTRMILAVVLGIIISHPLVLFIFNESITQKVHENHRLDRVKEIKSIQSTYSDDEKLIIGYEAELQCITTLQSYEMAGGTRQDVYNTVTNKTCGRSSGNGTCGPICKDKYQTRINGLNKKINTLTAGIDAEKARYKTAVDEVSTELNTPPSTDYIARTRALEKLGQEHAHIWLAEKLLIFALILIDCLLVILKATTPMGAYEIKKDQLFYEANLFADVERSAMKDHSSVAYKGVVDAKLKLHSTKSEMDTVLSSVNDFLKNFGDQVRQFDKNLSSISKNHDLGLDFKTKMRDLYKEAFSKAAGLMNKFLKL